jgi:hypothetical protein
MGNVLTDELISHLNNSSPVAQLSKLGSRLDEALMVSPSIWPNVSYFVDSVNGSDNNDGLTPGKAFATIKEAINAARYVPGTSNIDYGKEHISYIFVRPGHYNEQLLYAGYNIHIFGLGFAVPGKDYGVSINYDGAVADTCVIGFQGSGNSIHNVHVYCDGAFPAVYVANGDNHLLNNIVIEGDGVNATYGVLADSMKGSWIKDLMIHGCNIGIGVQGGADHYFIHGGIENCQIHSDITGAKGIWVDGATLVSYNTRIHKNFIELVGAGATAKGIDIDNTGVVPVMDNFIQMAASATGIEHAGSGAMFNHVFLNGVLQGADSKTVHDGSLA